MSTRLNTVNLPTSVADVRLVVRTIRLVLSIPTYATGTVVATGVGLSTFVLSSNLGLVRNIVLNGQLPLGPRLEVLLNLYPFVGNGYRSLSAVLLVLTAILFGINLTLLAYHLRRKQVSLRNGSGSLLGVLFGALGAGCAACGTALLAGLASLVGGSSLLLALPLEGTEFTIISSIVLFLSTYWLATGMRGGEIAGCPVNPR